MTMKRDLDEAMRDLDGKPFADNATLKQVIFAAVTSQTQDDAAMPVAEKMMLYGLAQAVNRGGVVELTAEQIAVVKARIGKLYPVLVVGEAYRLLEQNSRLPIGTPAEEKVAELSKPKDPPEE
jgi:putative N-acetylmannosamine-6-phosphate epimerase